MTFLHVDDAACVRCGRYAEVCVSGAVGMGPEGPYLAREMCIACGHCVAVCPTAALANDRSPAGPPLPDRPEGPNCRSGAEAALFLRSRHSERCFRPDPVPRAVMESLLDMARYAPTGGNTQGMRYLAVDDRAVLDAIIAAAFAWGREERARGTRLGQLLALFEERYRTEGRDTILWGAPCLVLALPREGRFIPSPRDSAIFSLLYAQLYAPSLGLGTCWSGIVDAMAAAAYPGWLDILRPYGGGAVAGAIMVGYPRHAYHRLVEREPLRLDWVAP